MLSAVAWQVLNAINKGGPEGKIRYFIRDPNKRDKAKERIAYAFEKIFILVRPFCSTAEQQMPSVFRPCSNDTPYQMRAANRLTIYVPSADK
jgi:hypothetical protein